jgi:hypothetical protein
MIQLVKGEDKNVIITLTERTTISSGYYYFQFIHETTKEEVTFFKNFTDNLSLFKYRYDEFLFEASLFNNASIGKYIYNIYQATTNNLANVGIMIETGKMDINLATPFSFKQYSADTNYTQYAG